MPPAPRIVAAGAVVLRPAGRSSEVLLVHRPKYDDWSFPKGKVDPGEHALAAAVREVAEESGLRVRLGVPLRRQHYVVRAGGKLGPKDVHYWVARAVGDDDVAAYEPNDEIDEVAWVAVDKARRRLTYPRDRETLAEAVMVGAETVPLVVLRHARARSRSSWSGDDRRRPLTEAGTYQARQTAPLLDAYGVTHVLTSSSKRCRQTVKPFAAPAGVAVEHTDDLSQEDATPASVSAQVDRLLARGEPTALCTHRPVLPWVFEALALRPRKLDPGSMCVVHHRGGTVVAVERHDTPFR